jgi:hypothetical protein
LQEAMESRAMVIREPVPVENDDRVQNIRLTPSQQLGAAASRIARHEGAFAGDGRGI